MSPADPTPEKESGAPRERPARLSFFAELRRRKVVRVAITYSVVAWLIIQVAANTFSGFGIPEWAFRFVVLMLLLGFPVAIILAWAFELTPDGVKLTRNVSVEEQAKTSQAKRNWTAIGFAAFLPTLIFGALAVYFYLARSESDREVEKSIAVLPFENRSNNPEDAFFTDGIHDDLLTQISLIRDIKTISRTSVLAYRDTTKNMREIGEELGVAHILEGGVQRSGTRVRINLQLIDARTDAHLWADTYTRELTAENLFEIQSEIAVSIAAALQTVLSPEDQGQIDNLPTQNLAALEAYFRAKVPADLVTVAGFREAVDLLSEAIRLDDRFADAYAMRAALRLMLIWHAGLDAEVQTALAEPDVRRALELNSRLPMAHVALAGLRRYQNRADEAENAFQAAIRLAPNNSYALVSYGNFKSWVANDPVAAKALFEKAVELDPKNRGARQELAETEIKLGNFQRARRILEDVLEENPDAVQTLRTLGTLLSEGFDQFDKAIRLHRRALNLDPGSPEPARRLFMAYRDLGDFEHALFWLERAWAISPDALGEMDPDLKEAWRHFYQRDDEGFMERIRALNDRNPEHEWAAIERAEREVEAGDCESALERLRVAFPGFEIQVQGADGGLADLMNHRRLLQVAVLLHRCGQTKIPEKIAREVLVFVEGKPSRGTEGTWFMDLGAYWLLGDTERALAIFRQDTEEAGGCYTVDGLVFGGTLLSSLQGDPEFERLQAIRAERRARQLANLARWEADGTLAPIPDL